jgi:DNA invertase Pin-like site-specific DNA recombinase
MKRRNVAYLRVSTPGQDNKKFEASVLMFANDRGFHGVEFVEETASGRKSWKDRKIYEVIKHLGEGDRLLTPELSRLGRSTLDVLSILKEAKDKGIAVYSIKEGFELNGNDIQSKVMATMLALVAELERDFISQRTKEGLAAARARGVKLGRRRGIGKSKLDPHREEIIKQLKLGVQKRIVAKRFGCSSVNLYQYLRRRKINTEVDLKVVRK